MQHTLVAVFGNRTDAQNAMNALISSGFPPHEVMLSNADPTGMTDSTTGGAGATPGGGAVGGSGANLRRVFTDLFGADNSIHASRYEGAVTRGHHVLTVRADSLPDAERAADIVECFGPSDIDAGASQAGAMELGGTGAQPGSMRMAGAGSMQQASPMPAQPRAGSRPGARPHLDNPGDGTIFQQHSLYQSEPTGGTYQEPLGESGLGATGSTSLHSSTLRENAAHVPSFEDIETGPGGSGSMQRATSIGSTPPEASRLTETQRGRSRIYSAQPSSDADAGGGLDVGSNFFGDDDDYYRNHFLANYGGEHYDHVKPAYAYGAEMAHHDEYRGREWHEVESELRSDWEHRNAGMAGATWEKMKAAVRRGWDRITLHHDDSYYRSHYDTHLGGSGMDYDSVKPAYSYGAEMRKSELYRNRPWDDVEGDLARAWETRSATGAGARKEGVWDRIKAAVRHGWERVKS